MLTLTWFVLIAMMVALCAACDLGRGYRMPGAISWFVILPQMQEPTKKAKGRMQQKRKRRR